MKYGNRRERDMRTIAVVICGALAIAALTLGLTVGQQMRQDNVRLTSQLQAASKSESALRKQLAAETATVSGLSVTVRALDNPVDPLANYSQVCTIYAGGVLGNSQPWYLPCATSAETIPEG